MQWSSIWYARMAVPFHFQIWDELFITQPQFAAPALPHGKLLSKPELHQQREVWLKPISSDTHLRNELRGWYRIRECWAENEYGNRFFLDSYGSKWLVFTVNEKILTFSELY